MKPNLCSTMHDMPLPANLFQVGRRSSTPGRMIAVGTVIADRPPHRSVRAELPHTVLTLDVDMQTSRLDKGGESSASVAIFCRVSRTFSRSGGGHVGCVDAVCAATCPGSHHGIVSGVCSFRELRSI